MRRFLPSRISGQLVLLLVMAMLVANLLQFGWFRLAEGRPGHRHPGEMTGRLAALVELLDTTPPEGRALLLGRMAVSHPDFRFETAGSVPEPEPFPPPRGHDFNPLAAALGPGFGVQLLPPAGGEPALRRYRLTLRDGTAYQASEAMPGRPPFPGPAEATLLALALMLAAVLLWVARGLTRPLRQLETATEAYDPGRDVSLLPEAGPREVRALAAAFNRMQHRIADLQRDRMLALAAISHDLRTPITRMRLRAELLPHSVARGQLIADLDRLAGLVQSALHYLQGANRARAHEAFDLVSLALTVADQFGDLGQALALDIPQRLVLRGDPDEIHRAVSNLVQNAFQYGASPCLRVRAHGAEAAIEVEDRGPGLPESHWDEALQPFVRADGARGDSRGAGFGLGLSIARDIAVRHGGRLELEPAVPHGLVVRLRLPLEEPAPG